MTFTFKTCDLIIELLKEISEEEWDALKTYVDENFKMIATMNKSISIAESIENQISDDLINLKVTNKLKKDNPDNDYKSVGLSFE